jgi:hypothetical protein
LGKDVTEGPIGILSLTWAVLACASASSASAAPEEPQRYQTVGCPADGQTGPRNPPTEIKAPISKDVSPETAEKLSYYASEDIGVLAPRGWHCFGTSGSAGQTIYVAPDESTLAPMKSFSAKPVVGPMVQLSVSVAGTSGRFDVARFILLLFPSQRSFAQSVIDERLMPKKDFPNGPYPTDILTYKSKEIVEYRTPARHIGLGTESWLGSGPLPIAGVTILEPEGDMQVTHLAARLPKDIANLTAVIVHFVEKKIEIGRSRATTQ